VENQSILGNKQFLEAIASKTGISLEKGGAVNQAVAKVRNLVMEEAKLITKDARQTVKETETAKLKGHEKASDSEEPVETGGSKKSNSPETGSLDFKAETENATSKLFVNTSNGEKQATAGITAKEAVISAMQVLYGAGSAFDLQSTLSQVFTPLSAFAFLVFVLLYTPCVAAIAATRREMANTRSTVYTIIFQTGTAWIVSFLIFQIGRLIL
jgi:hypothetical protein